MHATNSPLARAGVPVVSAHPCVELKGHRWSVDLWNATLLGTPSTLIFLFKRALSGSNLIFFVGASDD